MGKIQILDCTLRDGGYVNNWEFGEDAIHAICRTLADVGVDIAELGFMRNEPYTKDRAIYSSVSQFAKAVGEKSSGLTYAALIEMANYFPPDTLSDRTPEGPDAIRYSFWMRCMDEAYEYCARIRDKGYLLCCQPTRVEQYSDEQFADMCRRFSKLDPYALYIVDTFGLLRKDDLLRYARIGHENLAPGIILGYHAHDNMGQAFSNACAFVDQDYGERTVQVDATIGGIGRGAGNLRLEMILEYLNETKDTQYDLTSVYRVWDEHIEAVRHSHPWGFDFPYFIAAANGCSPNYAGYFISHGLSVSEIKKAIMRIRGDDKFLYSDEKAARYAQCI